MSEDKLSPGQGDNQLEQANSILQDCIDNCTECSRLCLQLIPHCLDVGGEHATSEHINILHVCSIICETNAKLMTLDSEFYHDLCRLSAEVSTACAADCDALSKNDAIMVEGAEICRKTAESCNRMLVH
ncbi:four-helix bundle copper-binding protein [Bdellovibrio svalbardensis]|uniref:Four-helix bundle copper-binding protein n=1 Tax=Bdellovibrio svalbardensis TaxID=2972972 RepID=A0ABT6DHK8_9BACT|nr:four-helix bundle copper-binding protein [Bdellovibrio svalbardensis]MDG0816297.1 four-helix bundle copper-binding protein [Bdellovibrio svalbardensis]